MTGHRCMTAESLRLLLWSRDSVPSRCTIVLLLLFAVTADADKTMMRLPFYERRERERAIFLRMNEKCTAGLEKIMVLLKNPKNRIF